MDGGKLNRRRWLLASSQSRHVFGSVICALSLVAAILAGCGGQDAPDAGRGVGTATPLGALPLALPSGIPTHFSFGVMNGPGNAGWLSQMRSENGTAWDFRYTYLDGGVNSGRGWETWQSPAGAFASGYLSESAAGGFTPVFVYYELLQSSGACSGCAEADRDLTALRDPNVMGAYYANWRLLMQQIGAFGKPVLVIVEPDVWGYIESSVFAGTDSAASVTASVATSGDHDATSYPNTAQGFAWAMLHIRDLYAPHAMLALHVSPWAAGDDISSSTDSSLSLSYDIKTTSAFLRTAGLFSTSGHPSTWDILSADVSSQDSGQGAAWWDPTNSTFPNFTRYLSFAGGVSRATGRGILLWQVPEGNQYFDTETNLPHHTQDNRAQYILAHVDALASAGIVGVLFGTRTGGSSIDDAAHDDVTNPPPISSYACDHCNTHLSTYPDDDGGYLRLFVGAYYRHGPLQLANPKAWTPAPPPTTATATPLPAGTCTSAPVATIGTTTVSPNPVAPGGNITVTPSITMSCNTTILVYIEVWGDTRLTQFDVSNIQAAQGQLIAVPVPGVVPTTALPGRYTLKVGVFDVTAQHQEGWDNGAASLVVS